MYSRKNTSWLLYSHIYMHITPSRNRQSKFAHTAKIVQNICRAFIIISAINKSRYRCFYAPQVIRNSECICCGTYSVANSMNRIFSCVNCFSNFRYTPLDFCIRINTQGTNCAHQHFSWSHCILHNNQLMRDSDNNTLWTKTMENCSTKTVNINNMPWPP